MALLPVHLSNALKYSLTWSTDGLINEYGNLCYGIEDGRKIPLQPLEGYETISWTGCYTEAFNTSGAGTGRQFGRPCENDELQDPALSGSLRENPLSDEGSAAERRSQDAGGCSNMRFHRPCRMSCSFMHR